MGTRSLQQRRDIARQRTFSSHIDALQPSTFHWPNIQNLLDKWVIICKSTISKMKVCGDCGYARFGNQTDNKFLIGTVDDSGMAPYSYCNMFLKPFIHIDALHYNICSSCANNSERKKLLSFMSPAYIRALLKAKPLYLQMLSLVDCRLGIENKFNGFYAGFVQNNSLLDSPLISWNYDTLVCNNVPVILKEVYDVFASNLVFNKLYKKYLCMLEIPDPTLGISVITSHAVEHIVETQRNKGIVTNSMSVNPFDPDLHILEDISCTIPHGQKRKSDLFHSGTMHSRRRLHFRDPLVTDIYGQADEQGETLETMLFPFLFPQQRGCFTGDRYFANYVKQRMQQLFSPFTLFKPYVLLLHQMKQTFQLISASSVTILDKEYKTLQDKNLSEEEIYRRILKQNVDFRVPGSPAWHARHLKDLKCMVAKWGLPSFFLTLTCDEVSDTRWSEINDLENLVHHMNPQATWKDCPVECAVLFHCRMTSFLKTFILCGDNGLLGHVEQHVVRYELQGRNSLHAHIVLWVQETDVDRIGKEIAAYIPATFDPSNGTFLPPTSPMELLLFNLVTAKQMHRCKLGVCVHPTSEDGPRFCKLGFPKDVQLEKDPVMDPLTGKWCYYRPSSEHRNVVPFHPSVLLLWGAHMNLQRVTNESWSFYLLKYALKCEPSGSLNINAENAKSLGLDNLSEVQLKLVSGAVMSRSVSSTEAAISSLQIPIIQRSTTVHFIDSSPPDRRTRFYKKASVVCCHPTRIYADRPQSMETLSFCAYFERFEVLSSHTKQVGYVGLDLAGNHVYGNAKLVRFADYHPVYHTNQFFYNVLLRHVNFRNEAELVARTDGWWTYLHECISRKIVNSQKDIEELVIQYGRGHLYSQVYIGDMVAKISSTISSSIWHEAIAGIYTIPLPRQQSTSARDGPAPSLSELTGDQLEVFQSLKNMKHGLHVLSGAPGCGKTFFTKFLKAYWESQGKRVLLTATTGIAALRLHASARTVHTAFNIPIRGELKPLCRSSTSFDELHLASVIVIDECSMLTNAVFKHIASRIHEVSQGSRRVENPFNVKLVLLVGDLCQLPPVCKHRLEPNGICMQCHISSSPHYAEAMKHQLTTVLRQATDPSFLDFLNVVRRRLPSQQEIDACLAECYVEESEVDEYLQDDTTCICSHRSDVVKFNYLSLLKYFPVEHIVELQVRTDAPVTDELQAWASASKFHEITHLAIGSKVILTENINLDLQAANGSSATVIDLQVGAHGDQVEHVIVKLCSNNYTLKISRSKLHFKRISGRECYSRATFPLILGYAITGHKSQGGTFAGNVLIMLKNSFAPGLTYVMLSRVTNRKNLRIIGQLCPGDFHVFRG